MIVFIIAATIVFGIGHVVWARSTWLNVTIKVVLFLMFIVKTKDDVFSIGEAVNYNFNFCLHRASK